MLKVWAEEHQHDCPCFNCIFIYIYFLPFDVVVIRRGSTPITDRPKNVLGLQTQKFPSCSCQESLLGVLGWWPLSSTWQYREPAFFTLWLGLPLGLLLLLLLSFAMCIHPEGKEGKCGGLISALLKGLALKQQGSLRSCPLRLYVVTWQEASPCGLTLPSAAVLAPWEERIWVGSWWAVPQVVFPRIPRG